MYCIRPLTVQNYTMATYNQMLEEDSQVIESSFDERSDSSYSPNTSSSAGQTILGSYLSESDGSTMDWQSYEHSVVSMEVCDMFQYNEAQESLMDVSDYTDTTGNSPRKFTLIVL